MLKWSVQCQQPLLVSMRPRPNPQPAFIEPDTRAVKFCCCFSRGTVSLGGSVDRSLLSRGENVGVSIACKNDSSQELTNVKIVLTEHIFWKAQSHNKRQSRELVRIMMDGATVNIQPAASSSVSANTVAVAGVAAAAAKEIYAKLSSNPPRGAFTVADSARDTYAGALLTVRHSLTGNR